KIAAPQFRIWSPTTLLSVALCSLTNVDRTGNSASCMVWPQPKVATGAKTIPMLMKYIVVPGTSRTL
ncbi:hypothetical protein METBIDRAFT_43993, partial [Metschnikowia bicuspidata var. bicuspidata NRRL YB-4993]